MEENQTGKTVSSGAKKVEVIEEKKSAPKQGKKQPKANAVAVKKEKVTAVKKEKADAEKRVDSAKKELDRKEKKLTERAEAKQRRIEKRAELKQKKLEKKAALAEKRLAHKAKAEERRALLKSKRLEHKAEREARKEMLRNETKAERMRRLEREKKERIALRRQKNERRQKAAEEKRKARMAAKDRKSAKRKHKREQKTERKKHAPGFGGWLAATISLGVVCLALTTVVTAGMFRMNDMMDASVGEFRETVYEMTEASESMDYSLDKLRIASGREDTRTLLTDVLIQTSLLESGIERCPIDEATATSISDFINRTNRMARRMLDKLASGESLDENDHAAIEKIYAINERIHEELNRLSTSMTMSEIKDFLWGKSGAMSNVFGGMTDEEESPRNERPMPESNLAKLDEVTVSDAEKTVEATFSGYHICEIEYTGEVAGRVSAYNFRLTDENGGEFFVQVSKNGGKVMFFDHYSECEDKNFDLDTCDSIAREFLSRMGYEDVDAVWLSDGGMVADITYAGVQNGARVYSDLIRIRVCESRGIVVGMDASKYLEHHKEDRSFAASISKDEALGAISSGANVESWHLAVIPVRGREVLAYEFGIGMNDREYLVYVDATTGEELLTYCVREDGYGRYLR